LAFLFPTCTFATLASSTSDFACSIANLAFAPALDLFGRPCTCARGRKREENEEGGRGARGKSEAESGQTDGFEFVSTASGL